MDDPPAATPGAWQGAGSLFGRYAGIVCDIDGVLVRGANAIPGAARTLAALCDAGLPVALVTNNAARTPADVAALLAAVGIAVAPADIVTSAQAAAALLAPGTRCLVIGAAALREVLDERGCVLVREPADAEAVVVGWDRDLVWDDLRRAGLALQRGVRFLATNGDRTFPTPEGLWPGNGAALAALVATTGRVPEIAGKPAAPVFMTAAARLGVEPLLMVGDRHETDLVGAAALGWDTALVLCGVTTAAEVGALTPPPTWVLDDISGLLAPPPATARPDASTASRPSTASPAAGPTVPSVRAATAADRGAILALWETAGMLAYTPDAGGDLDRVIAHDPGLVLVAERDGAVVATLLGTADGRRGWLQRLAVAPAHRRAGLGRLLVAEIERLMAARGLPQINLLVFPDNADGLAFWRGLGYDGGEVALLRKRFDADPIGSC